MNRADTDVTPQQTDSADYPKITATTRNGAPRQKCTFVLYLKNSTCMDYQVQMTRTDEDFALQQKESMDCPTINITVENVPPRKQHTEGLYLCMFQLASANKKINRTTID